MKKLLIAASLGSLLLTGCTGQIGPMNFKPSVPHREMDRYDWVMQAMGQIKSEEMQRCLAVVNDTSIAQATKKEDSIKEISFCAVFVGNVASRLTYSNLVPSITSPEMPVLLDRANIATNLKAAKEVIAKKLKVVTLETVEDREGITRIKAGQWVFGDADQFEIGSKGLIWGKSGRKAMETGSKLIVGSTRNVYVQIETPKAK